MVTDTFSSRPQEEEASESLWVPGQPGNIVKLLFPKQTTKEKKSKHYDVLNIEIYVKPDFVVVLLFMLSLDKYKNFSSIINF